MGIKSVCKVLSEPNVLSSLVMSTALREELKGLACPGKPSKQRSWIDSEIGKQFKDQLYVCHITN